MAKITITIEDTPGDRVKIISAPTFDTMANMVNSGELMTSAHGYALRMIRAARDLSKETGPATILIPRVGK